MKQIHNAKLETEDPPSLLVKIATALGRTTETRDFVLFDREVIV